jgi:hypothetical protein
MGQVRVQRTVTALTGIVARLFGADAHCLEFFGRPKLEAEILSGSQKCIKLRRCLHLSSLRAVWWRVKYK